MTLKTRAPRNRTLVLTSQERNREVPRFNPRSWKWDSVCCVDAIEAMRSLPVGCVDLLIADPPYNKGKNFGNNVDRRDDYAAWTAGWIAEAVRLLREDGSMYVCAPWEHSGLMQATLSEHLTIRNRITWKRDKGRGAKRNWKNNMEDVWFATKGEDYIFNLVKWKKRVIAPYRENGKPKDWEEEGSGRYRMTHPSNIWTDLCVPFWSMPENTSHPTQKPEKMMERIIEASSNLGDRVFDPFIGSGTTLVAAKRLGRRFLGCEINPEYVRLTLKRLAAAAPRARP